MEPERDGVQASASLADVEPLDPDVVFVCYQAALDTDGPVPKRTTAYLLLGLSRLGMHPSTLAHAHEDWVDWRAGVVRVPAQDPCACQDCLTKVREDPLAGPPADALGEKTWRPPTPAGDRAIPFGWSKRLTAVLMEFFERNDHLPVDVDVTEVVRSLASRAPGIDAEQVTPARLRASAVRTHAALGFDAAALARIAGVDSKAAVERFVRRARPVAGEDGAVGHLGRYRLVTNPEPLPAEPFDVGDYGEEVRVMRADRGRTTSRLTTNPRPPAPALDDDPSLRPSAVDGLDPEGQLVTVEDDSVQVLLDAWVSRQDDRTEPDSLDLPAHLDGGATHSNGSGSDVTDTAADGTQTGDGEAVPAEEWGPMTTPVAVLADGSATELETTFASPAVTDGSVLTGTVALTDDALLFDISEEPIQADAISYRIPLSSVVNVAPDYTPSGLATSFEAGVGLKVVLDDEQIVALDVQSGDRLEFLTDLFDRVLDGCEAIVTSPLKRGGRVIEDKASQRAELRCRGETLELRSDPETSEAEASEAEAETIASIYLGRVTDVDTCLQKYDSVSYRSLEIQHLSEQESITSRVGLVSDERTNLLRKFVTLLYKRRMAELRDLSLSEAEKQLLVSLHSIGDMDLDGMDLAGMLDMDGERLGTILQRLSEKGLVSRGDGGVDLTDTGRVAVSETLDDVNF